MPHDVDLERDTKAERASADRTSLDAPHRLAHGLTDRNRRLQHLGPRGERLDQSAATASWNERLSAYADPSPPLFDEAFIARWVSRDWDPVQADRETASELHTQMVSRISIQPLGYAEGDKASALESVFRLFGSERRAADRHFGAKHFDVLAWHVLNVHARRAGIPGPRPARSARSMPPTSFAPSW